MPLTPLSERWHYNMKPFNVEPNEGFDLHDPRLLELFQVLVAAAAGALSREPVLVAGQVILDPILLILRTKK